MILVNAVLVVELQWAAATGGGGFSDLANMIDAPLAKTFSVLFEARGLGIHYATQGIFLLTST